MKQGWTYLYNSPKWHYFDSENGGRSLCGRWMLFSLGDLESGNDNSPDNCKACAKKLAKRNEKYHNKQMESQDDQ